MSLQTIILNGSADVTLAAFVHSASGGIITSGNSGITATSDFFVFPTGATDDILTADNPGIYLKNGFALIQRIYTYEAVTADVDETDILLGGTSEGVFGRVYEAVPGSEPTLASPASFNVITDINYRHIANNPFAGGIVFQFFPSAWGTSIATYDYIYVAITNGVDEENILMSGDADTFIVTAPYHIVAIGGINVESASDNLANITNASYNYNSDEDDVNGEDILLGGQATPGFGYVPFEFDSIVMGDGAALHLSYTPTVFDSIDVSGTAEFGIGIITSGGVDVEDASAGLVNLTGTSYNYNADEDDVNGEDILLGGQAAPGFSYVPFEFDSIVMGGDADETTQRDFLYVASGGIVINGQALPGWGYLPKGIGIVVEASSAGLITLTGASYNYNAATAGVDEPDLLVGGSVLIGRSHVPTEFDSIVIDGESDTLFALFYEGVTGAEIAMGGEVEVNSLSYRYRPNGIQILIGGKPGLRATYNYNVVVGDLSIIMGGRVIPRVYKFKDPKPPWARFVMLNKQIEAARLNVGLIGLPPISDFRNDHQPDYCLAGREKDPLEPCISTDGLRRKGAWIPAVVAERQKPHLPTEEITYRDRRFVKS